MYDLSRIIIYMMLSIIQKFSRHLVNQVHESTLAYVMTGGKRRQRFIHVTPLIRRQSRLEFARSWPGFGPPSLIPGPKPKLAITLALWASVLFGPFGPFRSFSVFCIVVSVSVMEQPQYFELLHHKLVRC